MKILNITDSYLSDKPADLAGIFIHRQSLRLSRLGYDLRVINPQPLICKKTFSRYYSFYSEKEGIRIFRPKFFYIPILITWGKIYDWFYSRAVWRAFNQFEANWKPDLILCDWLVPGGAVSVKISNKLEIPLIMRARGYDVRWIKQNINKMGDYHKQIGSQVNWIICNGYGLYEDLKKLDIYDVEKLRVLTNGIDTRFFHPATQHEFNFSREKLRIPNDARVIVFIGSWIPRKGTNEIAEVLPKILENNPNVYFLVCGPVIDKVSQEKFQAVMNQAFFLGMVSQDTIVQCLHAADFFILPSRAEGLPNAMLEAMASGLASIVTEVGGNSHVIRHEINGLLIEPENKKMLESAILRCLSDSDFCSTLGINARQTITDQQLDMDSVIQRLDDIFRSTTKNYQKT